MAVVSTTVLLGKERETQNPGKIRFYNARELVFEYDYAKKERRWNYRFWTLKITDFNQKFIDSCQENDPLFISGELEVKAYEGKDREGNVTLKVDCSMMPHTIGYVTLTKEQRAFIKGDVQDRRSDPEPREEPRQQTRREEPRQETQREAVQPAQVADEYDDLNVPEIPDI